MIGPNGAGKSTVLNMICGTYRPDSGSIELFGQDVTKLSPARRVRAGIGRSFQRSTVFERLSARQNVLVAGARSAGRHRRVFGRWSQRDLAQAEDLLTRVGLGEARHRIAGSLGHGEKRALEIAICLATKPRVLVLDEPTQGLSASESRAMAAMIRDVTDEQQLPTLLVEHDMDAVRELAARVLVLAQGELLAEGTPEEVGRSETVRRVYLGEEFISG